MMASILAMLQTTGPADWFETQLGTVGKIWIKIFIGNG